MLNILLADDDDDERYFFEIALAELPIERNLRTVSNGEELIYYLSQNADSVPDVIFLDIMMPRKNGIECLKEIMGNEKLKRIPVVMYSDSIRDDFVNICYQCGASYFLQKGDYSELKESLRRLLAILEKPTNHIPKAEFKFR